MLLDCVYILEHHPNLFLANFWALNCVGNLTGSNLFEPELDRTGLRQHCMRGAPDVLEFRESKFRW